MKLIVLTSLLLALALAKPSFRKRPEPDSRIINGYDVDIESVPWQVSLEWGNFDSSSHFCGGIIFDTKIVITAAHCTDVIGIDPDNFLIVRYGTSILESGGKTIKVKKYFQHPSYDYSTIDYDISVLLLAQHIELGNASPVRVPPQSIGWNPGTEVFVSGWGVVHEGDYDLPQHLQGVNVTLISNEQCRKAYTYDRITDRMICAIGENNQDACQGDSGGPLVMDDMLAGIVSWGHGCGEEGFPGVYTAAAEFSDFISSIWLENPY